MTTVSFKPSELATNPDWEPPSDSVFQYLLEQAALGLVPVFAAAVPLARIKRFDPAFHPEETPEGGKGAAAIMQHWDGGEISKAWVYPRGDIFILSDDYFTLAAAEKGKRDFVPCLLLGQCSFDGLKNAMGPAPLDFVRKSLGLM